MIEFGKLESVLNFVNANDHLSVTMDFERDYIIRIKVIDINHNVIFEDILDDHSDAFFNNKVIWKTNNFLSHF